MCLYCQKPLPTDFFSNCKMNTNPKNEIKSQIKSAFILYEPGEGEILLRSSGGARQT
jgi:hypothetical protein